MLTRISIRDILLIDHIELEFDQALNVLTGETGAGKSILLDCLGFVLGWRGRAELVRKGATQGEVEAEFEISSNSPIHAILDEAGLSAEDGLLIRRVNSADGRKRGFINDRAVSGDLLREVGAHLVEMHGQHDDKGLLDEKSHITLLDQYASIDLSPLHQAVSAWRLARKALEKRREDEVELVREAEFIAHAHDELSKLGAEVGEETKLDEKRRLMQQGEKLTQEFATLMNLLGHEGVGHSLSEALRRARQLSDKLGDLVEEPMNLLESGFDQISEAETAFERLASQMNFDERSLEETEDRLFGLRAAARKYACTCDELPVKAAEFARQFDAFSNNSQDIEKLEKAEAEAFSVATTLANSISEKRQKAAFKLDKEIQVELAPLKMENAIFTTHFEEAPLSNLGVDKVRFIVQTNPGSPAGSLSKIASGGELSRFLLALKLCLHQNQEEITMIFDEIDRGVGGQTADAVGRRLRMLSQKAQLLVVTHSPQVAALGSKHFLVSKAQSKDDTRTEVMSLGVESRTHEVARMISGDSISAEAIAAAQKLIEAQGA